MRVFMVFAAGCAPQAATPPPMSRAAPDFVQTAQRVGPTVVSVVSTFARAGNSIHPDADAADQDDQIRGRILRGIGSGIVLDNEGHVLTNEHVVASATRVHVELVDRRRIGARVLHADRTVDLAILRLDRVPDDLTLAHFRTAPAPPGTWVMGIGHPFGLGHTLSVGIISGLMRDHDDLGQPAGLLPGGSWSFIQTDASINIGNSGGPLVDVAGNVVGIVTAVRLDGSGIAFAIPTAMAWRYIDEFHRHGGLRHPRLGLAVRSLTHAELPDRIGGVVVERVDLAGPAAIAGIRPGDLIFSCTPDSDSPHTASITRVSQLLYCAQLSGVGHELRLAIARTRSAGEARYFFSGGRGTYTNVCDA